MVPSKTADKNLRDLSGYVNGRIKKLPSQETHKCNGEPILVNHDITLLSRKDGSLGAEINKGKHDITIDSACPTSLLGAKYFKKIFQSYPSSISSQFEMEHSQRTFIFGGGETTKSLGIYTFPVYLMDEKNDLHKLFLRMEIVEQDIIMLLGTNSLIRAGATLDLGNNVMVLPKLCNDAKFPLFYDSGHFIIPFYTLSKEDGYEAAQVYLTENGWSKKSATLTLNYVKNESKPSFTNVVEGVCISCKKT